MRAVAGVALVVFLAFPRGASAAPPRAPATNPESSPAVADAARARFNEGVKLYGRKKYEQAMAAFLQAHALTKNPAVLINLGLTSLKLGSPLEAKRYFDKFQKEAKDPTPDQRSRVQTGITEARRSLGAVDVTAPEGAEVSVDGEPAGRAPLASPVDVLPGRHDVSSTTTSGTKAETVTVSVGATVKVRLAAQRPSAPPNAVLEPERGPSGGAPGGATQGIASSSAEGTTTSMFTPPETSWPVYVAGAIGLASFTAAIVLGGIGANADRNTESATAALLRNGKSPDSCNDPASAGDPTISGTCSTLRSGQRTSDDTKQPLLVTLAVGAGTTVFALGWYFLAPKARVATEAMRSPLGPLRMTPVVGPRGEPGARLDVTF
jgi:hypothetical protein